jgi:CO dehydrogenase maturation factor
MSSFSVAVSGKGGTGKTTVSALLVRALVRAGKRPVLAVDADPNANLHEALGMSLEGTLGCMREEAFRESIPPGMARNDYLALRFRQSLVEGEGFDLIAMGRPEGSGCYCFAHDVLRTSLGLLGRDYPFMVIDNEAGMEHLARETIGVPDLLLIVSTPDRRGIRTAARISELARSLGLAHVPTLMVLNRWRGEEVVSGPSVPELIATIPEDPAVLRADLEGRPVGLIPDASPAAAAVEQMAREIIAMADGKEAVPDLTRSRRFSGAGRRCS